MTASLFDRLQERAVEIHVADHLRSRLNRGEKIRVKLGMDPTAPDIHVGHLVVLDVLRAFQDENHTVVLIIGDYTALIGDPSGRSETRPMLTEKQVAAHARTYLEQVDLVLDRKKTEVHGNSEWLAGMGAGDILRLMGKATLQQVLQREDFAQRLKEGAPVGAHEILYPFSQAYDSVAIRADLEIGGTDQLFNLLFGREIQQGHGQEPQDVAVFPLLEGPDGRRMSKSLGNYIGISEAPEQIYGKTMSIPDRLTEQYLRLVSGLEARGIAELLALKPRDAKAALAKQLVRRLHGEEAARRAEEAFVRQFVKKETPAEIEEHKFAGGPMDIISVLVAVGIAKSGNDARRLVEQGGVRIDGEKAEINRMLVIGEVISGRRRFIKLA